MTLFVSEGALAFLREQGVPVPEPVKITPKDLPADKRMLLGDGRDWDV